MPQRFSGFVLPAFQAGHAGSIPVIRSNDVRAGTTPRICNPRFSVLNGCIDARYIPALDGLRAVAVLVVIAYHFGILNATGGFLGVDLFFVLSGFLITSLLVRESRSTGTVHFKQFWARRFRRLMPASLLVLVAVSMWAWAELDSISLHSVRYDLLATLGYAANWRFVASGQSYFELFNAPSPIRHAWSLAIEEQFYVVWPVVTYLFLRARARGESALLAFCVVGTAISTALMWLLFNTDDPSRVYYGTDTRAAQLLVGAIFALIVARRKSAIPPATARVVSTLSCAGVLACVFLLSDKNSAMYHGGFLAFSILVGVLLVSTVDSHNGPLHWILTSPPVVYIGKISYGLYLWHWPVSVALSETRTPLSGISLTLVRLVVTLVLSVLSFHILEKPIRYRTGWAAFTSRATRGKSVLRLGVASFLVTGAVIVFATASAQTPPEYLTGRQDEILVTDDTTPGLDVSAARMLLIGDSVAASLQSALKEEATARGLHFSAGTRPGCGLTTGLPADGSGKIVAWAHTCADGTISYLQKMVTRTRPDVILWLSSWEASSRIVDGRLYEPTHTDFGDELFREIDESVRILTADGAHVLFLTLPARARTSELAKGSESNAEASALVNDIMTTYSFGHPESTSVVDLATLVCPTIYPCEQVIDGVALRPRDGGHFGNEGAKWVAPRLFDLVEKAVTTAR